MKARYTIGLDYGTNSVRALVVDVADLAVVARPAPADVRRAAKTYMRDVRWAYVGDPARVSRERITAF